MARDEWADICIKILKIELAKRNMKYVQLQAALASIGVGETANSIRNKLSRGKFSAAFFIQCLLAIGVDTLVIPKDIIGNNFGN